MARVDYFRDPSAPRANRIVPATSAVVMDTSQRILVILRSDNGLWSIPGGTMDPGESVTQCCLREVKEETGFEIEITKLVGIYSDPDHVVAYDDGEVRQAFSICFLATISGGALNTSSESPRVSFVTIDELADLHIHPSIMLRINDALAESEQPFVR
ncbi:NUDIX hydrolase [Ferrimicrobium acidiphilum]|uniref:NUDIX hydrolase n=1 Tax=Ferrimicrobium acidiphilum TaxID=121039 RepID=UPI003C6D0130